MKKIITLITTIILISISSFSAFASPEWGGDHDDKTLGGSITGNKSYATDGVRISIYNISGSKPIQIGNTVDYIRFYGDNGLVNVSDVDYYSIPSKYSTKMAYKDNCVFNARCSKAYATVNTKIKKDLPKITGGFNQYPSSIQEIKSYFTNKLNIKDVLTDTNVNLTIKDLEEKGQNYTILLEPIGFFRFDGDNYALTATETALMNKDFGMKVPRLNYGGIPSYTHDNLPKSLFIGDGSEKKVLRAMGKLDLTLWDGTDDFPTLSGKLSDDTIIEKMGQAVIAFDGEVEEEKEAPAQIANPTSVSGDYVCNSKAISTVKIKNRLPDKGYYTNVTATITFGGNSRYNKTLTKSVYIPPQIAMDGYKNISSSDIGAMMGNRDISYWQSIGGTLESYQTAWFEWDVPPVNCNVDISFTCDDNNAVLAVNHINGRCVDLSGIEPPDPDPVHFRQEDFDGPTNTIVKDHYFNGNESADVKSLWSDYKVYNAGAISKAYYTFEYSCKYDYTDTTTEEKKERVLVNPGYMSNGVWIPDVYEYKNVDVEVDVIKTVNDSGVMEVEALSNGEDKMLETKLYSKKAPTISQCEDAFIKQYNLPFSYVNGSLKFTISNISDMKTETESKGYIVPRCYVEYIDFNFETVVDSNCPTPKVFNWSGQNIPEMKSGYGINAFATIDASLDIFSGTYYLDESDNKEVVFMEKLYAKLEKEYNDYIDSLKVATADEIIKKSYETVFKEDILLCFDYYELDDDITELLCSTENLLNILYEDWLNVDESYMENLQYSVESSINKITKD